MLRPFFSLAKRRGKFKTDSNGSAIPQTGYLLNLTSLK